LSSYNEKLPERSTGSVANGTAQYWARSLGPIVIIYILVTWFTNPWLMGDTVDYVDSIIAYHRGYHLQFWEFGHLLWRPFGWLVFRLIKPLTSLAFGVDDRAKATWTLMAINWIGGLVCLLVLRALTERVCRRQWILTLTPLALLFSSAFMNYGQTGSAYVPGMALILTGGLILVKNGEQPGGKFVPVAAAILMAGGVAVWVPLVLIVPGVAALPLAFGKWDRRTLRSVVVTLILMGCLVAVAYIAVVVNLRFNSVHDLKEWATAASHGMNRMRGIPRMVFGFANSFIDLGGEGGFFKRYLKNDPFNPVSLFDLVWSSLWKLGFVYFFLLCVFINLLQSQRGRLMAALVLVDLVPTTIFALFIFEAGDMSRYVATLPLVFLAVACSLCSDRSIAWTKYAIVGFLAVSAITNVRAMAKPTLLSREQRVEARINSLLPFLKPESRVVTSHLQDEINNFTRDFLFNPINRSGNLHYLPVVALNTAQVDHWQQSFATAALDVWDHNGDLWVSKRLLTPRPRPEWSWVEGDDSRVSWTDLYGYFSQFEMGQEVGGEDGFVLLPPSARNKELLGRLAQSPKL
jgi:hypothetical protein